MLYSVIVESLRTTRGDQSSHSTWQHRCVYNGDNLDLARSVMRHYTRPIDHISAHIVQTVFPDDGLGWFGQRRLG